MHQNAQQSSKKNLKWLAPCQRQYIWHKVDGNNHSIKLQICVIPVSNTTIHLMITQSDTYGAVKDVMSHLKYTNTSVWIHFPEAQSLWDLWKLHKLKPYFTQCTTEWANPFSGIPIEIYFQSISFSFQARQWGMHTMKTTSLIELAVAVRSHPLPAQNQGVKAVQSLQNI